MATIIEHFHNRNDFDVLSYETICTSIKYSSDLGPRLPLLRLDNPLIKGLGTSADPIIQRYIRSRALYNHDL